MKQLLIYLAFLVPFRDSPTRRASDLRHQQCEEKINKARRQLEEARTMIGRHA